MEQGPSQQRGRRDAVLARRVLGRGALVGIGAGIAVQPFITSGYDGDLEWLVRLSMLLPAIVFIAWWLLSVGWTDERAAAHVDAVEVDLASRTRRIESVFDTAAVPRARREHPRVSDAAPRQRELRASIRRDDEPYVDPASFGVRRPDPHVRDADAT